MHSAARWRELPPTAGLPLEARDFGFSADPDLTSHAADFLAAPHAGLACSGTACLITILTALKKLAPERDTVIIPAYNCPLVVLAIAHCGLRVMLCDLSAENADMDHAMLALLCNERTLAVIPTHIGGRIMNVAAAARIARAQGAFVVEDAAQAFGARLGNKSVGLQADAGFFSLAVGKGLTLYEGGIWVTKDAFLAQAIATSAHQILKKAPRWELQRCVELAAYALVYRPGLLRLFYGNALRQDLARGEPEEAVGDVFDAEIPLHGISQWRQRIACRALDRLPGFLQETAKQAHTRREILQSIQGIEILDDQVQDAHGVWPVLVLKVPDQNTRDRIMETLWGSGMGVSRMFIHALPDYTYLRPWLAAGESPHARAFAARTFTITNSLWLDDADFSAICTTLQHYL